ncbi:T9SS type A sorting domain-containing protein [Deminuibacter soli]|uniref:T9SS C-terminal target domain-containing protein n=1 Tax=Deminuibacter soli TaxID=2291815 RepID=A0A3E1NDK8_9BACT|nr:T9SS type A sorting domain-containing protein [Deminuibacter soli]RFM26055.1 T9SS C-terminal target domain-containing protein [Deminuibacter soli]
MVRFLHKQFYWNTRRLITGIFVAALVCLASSFHSPEANAAGDELFYDVKIVKYYPNPATAFINFEFPQDIDKSYTLLIFSFVGKKITEMPVDNSKIIVNLNDYFRGIYVFQLKDRTGRVIETGKFQVIK